MCFIQIPLCLNPLSHILYTTLSKCSNKKLKKYKKISRILAGVVYILTLIFMEIDNLRELSAYTCSSLFWINMMLCLGVLKQLFSKGD